MIRISQQQAASMARDDFLKRIEALIQVNLSETAAARYNVRRMTEHCVAAGEECGLTTERAIAAFVLHMVNINPEFHRQSNMRTILNDRNVKESERMEKLLVNAAESDWEEAVAMCDSIAYWQPFLKKIG